MTFGFRSILAEVQWHALGALPWVVVGMCIVLAAVLWLYPPQVRTLGGAGRWLLPGLRGVALMALVLAFLQPVVISPRPTQDAGAIAVLVDVSRSMGVSDSGRGPAQWVQLADGLGLLPPDVRPEPARALPAMIERMRTLGDAVVRADGELEYARLSGRDVAEAQSRRDQYLTSLRETAHAAHSGAVEAIGQGPAVVRLKAVLDHIDTPRERRWHIELRSRLDQAERSLRDHQAGEDQKLYQANPQVRAACDALRDQSRLALVERALVDADHGLLRQLPRELLVFGYTIGDELRPLPLHRAGEVVEELGLEAHAGRTELTAPLPRVQEQLRGRDLQAIVLFSDGREAASRAQVVSGVGGGVPIFPVLSAPSRSVRDLVLADIDLPGGVFAGEQMPVRVAVRATGSRNTAATIVLRAGDTEQRREVKLKDDEPQTIEFSVLMEKPGVQEITVSAEPLANEASIENNSLRRSAKVLADKLKVAAYAGAPTWEFQYLRSAIEKARGIELKEAVLAPGAPLPLQPQELLELDVLILSEVPLAALSDAQKDTIHRLVTERGGSVLFLAGAGLPLNEYGGDVLLANLLPWPAGDSATWRTWPGESPGFRPAPAEAAANADVLRLADDVELAQQWLRLPAMFRVLAMPGLKPNARPLLVERDSGLPLLTEARLGAGRVFTWAAAESWRWRWKVGERYHARFWVQLLRHAAEAPYAAKDEHLAFDVDALRVESGREVRLRAKRLDATSGELRVRVMRGDEAIEESPLAAAGPAGRFERTLMLRDPGRYTLRLVDPSRPQAELSLPVEVTDQAEQELADLSPDAALLRRLAESSGGQMLSLESLPQLPAMLADLAERRSKTIQWSLWDSPYFFAFALSCLGLEWALRKRAGLA